MSIAKLIAGIGLNTDEFKKGINQVKADTESSGQGFTKLKGLIAGAFTVGAVVSFIGKLNEYVGKVKDAAEQTGSTASSIQALTAAGIENGASSEKMASGLQKIRVAQVDALDGNNQMVDAFGRLGISMEDIEGVGADQIFEMIGKSIAESSNKAASLSAAADILGNKLIVGLTPALKAVGEEGLDPLTQRMKDAGNIMDDSMISRIDEASDRFELFKTKILIFATDAISVFERIAGAIGAWSVKGGIDFKAAWDQAGADQKAAADRILKQTEDSNAGIIRSTVKVTAAILDGTDYLANIRAQYAKEAADAEIEEAERSKKEQLRIKDELAAAQDKYYSTVISSAWDQMEPEEKIIALKEKQAGLIAALQTLTSDYGEDAAKKMAKYYTLNTELVRVTGDIEKGERELGTTRKNEGNAAKTITNDQVTALQGMQTFLASMTDNELDQFLKVLRKIHDGIKGLDFSNLSGLSALQNFKIPNESVMNAQQFGKALAAMAAELEGLQLPDLQKLEVLKGFKIPNETSANARQFANAIATLVDTLKNQPLDLAPLQTLADLFDAINVGNVSIDINPPSKEDITLVVDAAFKSDIASLATSASTIASAKGILYA